MLLVLARKWTAVRVHPFQGHDRGRLGHLETAELTNYFSSSLQSVTATLFFASSSPSALLRFASRFFPFTTHFFLAGFSFLFIFQAGLALC